MPRHRTTIWEPLDLGRPHRRSLSPRLQPPPSPRSTPEPRYRRTRRRRGFIRQTGHGGLLMARNLSVFVLMVVLAVVFGLWLLFSYGAPALLDKLDKAPGEMFTTTTLPA